MRYGLLLGGTEGNLASLTRISRRAEQNGFDSVWLVEAYRSGLVPLAAIAAVTERVQLGPYVLNAYFRSPLAAGMGALELHEISGGRFAVGVGSGNRHVTEEWVGVPHTHPLAKMRDYIQMLHQIFAAEPGRENEYRGEVHSMRWERRTPRVEGDADIPVYQAAIFPKMLRQAGALADGICIGAMHSPAYVREVVRPAANEGAAEAGRDPARLKFLACVLVAVDEDRDAARELLRQAVAGVFQAHPHPYYEHALRQQGFGRQLEACLKAIADGDSRGATAAIDDEIVDACGVAGTPQQCKSRLADYASVLDEAVLTNVSRPTSDDRYEPLMALVAGAAAQT
jgi:alkanesulfonate monooxygenase SsuD/methylene tetrahydromethanopterin reductase-like flavin-dependent oxidoreductase (luciferase family)